MNNFNKINEYDKYIDYYTFDDIFKSCNGDFCGDEFTVSKNDSASEDDVFWYNRGGSYWGDNWTIYANMLYTYGSAAWATFLVVATN